jgi:hypothetical protein
MLILDALFQALGNPMLNLGHAGMKETGSGLGKRALRSEIFPA